MTDDTAFGRCATAIREFREAWNRYEDAREAQAFWNHD